MDVFSAPSGRMFQRVNVPDPPNPRLEKAVFRFFYPYYRKFCSGINRGAAVYQTGTHGSMGERLANEWSASYPIIPKMPLDK